MAATDDTLRLQQQLQDQLATITDTQTRALVAAWALAWDEVAADLRDTMTTLLQTGKVTAAVLLRSKRLQARLVDISDHLETLAATTRITITGDITKVVRQAAAAQNQIVHSQLPDLDHGLVDLKAVVPDRALDAIVRRTTQDIVASTRPLSADAQRAVRRELIRGVAVGSNPRATATRIVQRAEGGFNGGLNRALVISRTETLDAHRAAADAGQALHADVLTGWTWLAKLDARTCRSCWAQAGRQHPLDEPGPLDHQCGRCARMPKTMSWADLGIDLPEPDSVVPDAAASFEALPAADQHKILGVRGYAAWKSGRFPIEDWTRKRTSSGWRDSYGVAPAPMLTQSGGRRASAA